jgi:cell division protease FtsH
MTFGKKNEEIFLGREIQSHRDYSEVTARMIDEEISKIIRNAQRISENILNDNKDLLHSMAKSLLKFETIDAKDIKKILDGKKIIRRSNRKNLKNGRTKLKVKTSREKSKPLKSNGRL